MILLFSNCCRPLRTACSMLLTSPKAKSFLMMLIGYSKKACRINDESREIFRVL